MKYTLTNTINKALDEVGAKMRDPEGVKHWMEGLERIERISGTPGEVGAKSDFYFMFRGKEMKISETIVAQNLPQQIKFSYQSSMSDNDVELLFEKISENTTRQTSNNELHLKGVMKVMGFLMKGAFKKQSLKYMTAFKEYVEQ